MSDGLDYAGGRISGAALKNAGYGFVCRYLSDGGPSLPGKQLLANEVQDLQANGIPIVANWESSGTTAQGGYNAGVQDANNAIQGLKTAYGTDPGCPIYFSLDWDAAPEEQGAINAYFQGVASVIGLSRTGMYGGYWPLSRCFDAGVITWGWQTQAWSGGNVESRAHILQDNNAGYVYLGGVQCDLDHALKANFGQWPSSGQVEPPAPPTPPAESVQQQILDLLNGVDGWQNPQWYNMVAGREPITFQQLIKDPLKGPWDEPLHANTALVNGPDGKPDVEVGGVWNHISHGVLAAEATSWRYVDSTGMEVDLPSIMAVLWELVRENTPADILSQLIAKASTPRQATS